MNFQPDEYRQSIHLVNDQFDCSQSNDLIDKLNQTFKSLQIQSKRVQRISPRLEKYR